MPPALKVENVPAIELVREFLPVVDLFKPPRSAGKRICQINVEMAAFAGKGCFEPSRTSFPFVGFLLPREVGHPEQVYTGLETDQSPHFSKIRAKRCFPPEATDMA